MIKINKSYPNVELIVSTLFVGVVYIVGVFLTAAIKFMWQHT